MFGIELAPLFELVFGLLGVVLMTVAVWVAKRIGDKFKLDTDSEVRYLIDSVAYSAVNFALIQLKQKGQKFTPSVHNEVVANAVNYVIRSAPEALAYFGITEQRLREIIEARLPNKSDED